MAQQLTVKQVEDVLAKHIDSLELGESTLQQGAKTIADISPTFQEPARGPARG